MLPKPGVLLDPYDLLSDVDYSIIEEFIEANDLVGVNQFLAEAYAIKYQTPPDAYDSTSKFDPKPLEDFQKRFESLHVTEEIRTFARYFSTLTQQLNISSAVANRWLSDLLLKDRIQYNQNQINVKQQATPQEISSKLGTAPSANLTKAEIEQHAQVITKDSQVLTNMLEHAKQEVERIEKLLALQQEPSF